MNTENRKELGQALLAELEDDIDQAIANQNDITANMTTWRAPEEQLPPLLQAFRSATGKTSVVALEVLLLVAQQPRTLTELEELTGITKGSLSRAVQPFSRFADAKGQIQEPRVHLFNRRRIIGGRADSFKLTLTARARRLLETAA